MELYLISAIIFLLLALIIVSYFHFKFVRKVKVSQKMQEEFMAVTIHDLRSPLSVIKSSADLIKREFQNLKPIQITDMLEQVEHSATDLLGIVNNLLDISKLEAGKVELFKSQINISDFIENECNYYRALTSKKGIELRCKIDHSVPMINCDHEKIKHVLDNLMSNAIKFTQDGYVELVSKGYPRYVEIGVTDTGAGIPEESKKKLFNKFTQLEVASKTKEKGTGLGLVIVKGIIEAHGGRIWIEDNSPRGTKFMFTLPVEATQA